jgi:hypothetical protein
MLQGVINIFQQHLAHQAILNGPMLLVTQALMAQSILSITGIGLLWVVISIINFFQYLNQIIKSH